METETPTIDDVFGKIEGEGIANVVYEKQDRTRRTLEGVVSEWPDIQTTSRSFRTVQDMQRDFVELWMNGRWVGDFEIEYYGDVVDIEPHPVIEHGHNRQEWGGIPFDDGNMGDWFVDHNYSQLRWSTLLERAVSILGSNSVDEMIDEVGVDIDIPFGDSDSVRERQFTRPDTIAESRLDGSKRTNVRHVGNGWFDLYGKERGCYFEGSLWHLFIFALKVCSSENTKLLAEANGMDPDSVPWYCPQWREIAEERYRYSGRPYTFSEGPIEDRFKDIDSVDAETVTDYRNENADWA